MIKPQLCSLSVTPPTMWAGAARASETQDISYKDLYKMLKAVHMCLNKTEPLNSCHFERLHGGARTIFIFL